MCVIWKVMLSSQACELSTRAIIAASLERTTAWEASGFPKTSRCVAHLQEAIIQQCLDLALEKKSLL